MTAMPSPIASRLDSLRRRLGIDRAVFYAIATRGWTLVAGLVTVSLIATCFSPVVQGYYYTFSNLLATQSLVELGVGVVLVQFASHEWSALRLENGEVRGDAAARARLASLHRFAWRWYAVASVVLAGALAVGGLWFFSQGPQAADVAWPAPWLALCLTGGLVLATVPFFSLLVGCNQMAEANRYKLVQTVLQNVAAWTVMAAGGNLWTTPCALAVGVMWSAYFFGLVKGRFFGSLARVEGDRAVSWRDEILPLQWRIAISFLAGLVSYNLFAPVLFRYHGPVAAGQMGMSWVLLLSVSEMSITWVTVRTPVFGMLIAQRDYAELDRSFVWAARISLAVLLPGLVACVGLSALLNAYLPRLGGRLLAPLPMAILAAGILANSVTSMMAVYLRAHKREPLLGLSVVGLGVVGACTVYFGKHYGVMGLATSWSALAWVFLGLTGIVFARCRQAWHVPQAAPEEAPA